MTDRKTVWPTETDLQIDIAKDEKGDHFLKKKKTETVVLRR